MTSRAAPLALLLLPLLVACKGAAKPAEPSPEEERRALEGKVAAVDALVPADLKAKIHFEAFLTEKDAAAALRPAGWAKAFMPNEVKPPEGASLGFQTTFGVSTNCDGLCASKAWEPVVDKVEFAQFRRSDFKIERDEKGDGERFVAARSDTKLYLRYARWKAGASKYHYCRADLEKEAQAAAPAFEAACRSLRPLDW